MVRQRDYLTSAITAESPLKSNAAKSDPADPENFAKNKCTESEHSNQNLYEEKLDYVNKNVNILQNHIIDRQKDNLGNKLANDLANDLDLDLLEITTRSFNECFNNRIIRGNYNNTEVIIRSNDAETQYPAIGEEIGKEIGEEIDEQIGEDAAKNTSRQIIISCDQIQFFHILENKFSKELSFLAKYHLYFITPISSAYIFKDAFFRLKFTTGIIAAIYGLGALHLLTLLTNVTQMMQMIFKFYLLIVSVSKEPSTRKTEEKTTPSDLPIYSILVPLYREAGKVQKITKILRNLDYPKEKLDIKLIVEDDDYQTITALEMSVEMSGTNDFHIIKVPASKPRTKPKACNYALNFVTGEYLVIYDAEDRPDPDQLIKSVKMFRSLDAQYGGEYICLQSILEIEDKPDLLTKLFKMEYDMWFKFTLRGLSNLDLPITLGGTSNHFKTKELKALGAWDAYNVTEDAELGLRINMRGKKVAMLDSRTLEEGPMSLMSWLKQRTRWIKGFIITFVCYLLSNRNSNNSYQSIRNTCSVILFLGCTVFNFIAFPIMFMSIFTYSYNKYIYGLSVFNVILYYCYFWILGLFLQFSSYNNPKSNLGTGFEKSSKDEETARHSIVSLLVFPFYFFLHSLATYFALLEIMFAPHRWNKTDHKII